MSFYTLSLNFSSHDASVALFADDVILFFHQAERITRTKHDGILDNTLFDKIYEKYTKKVDLLIVSTAGLEESSPNLHTLNLVKEMFIVGKTIFSSREYKELFERFQLESFTHHTSHAVSAFYMSPFDEAVCLIADGIGTCYNFPNDNFIKKNEKSYGMRCFETSTIFEINKNYKTKKLYQRCQSIPVTFFSKNGNITSIPYIGSNLNHYNPNPFERFKNYNFIFDPSGYLDIGNMYHTISLHLNFGWHGEGKVMGLSAYGKEDPSLPPFLIEDTIYSNSNLFTIQKELNYLAYPELFGELSFSKKANIAYALQRAVEKIFLHHAEFIKKNSKIRNLIIGGGCALNILAVSLIKKHYPEFNIFVDPIAHDATHSIGAGIFFYNLLGTDCQSEKKNQCSSMYLGPEYTKTEMIKEIDNFMGNDNL